MRKLISFVFLLVTGCLGFSAQVMADMSLECPLSQAKRTITDPLPQGWWTTPIVYSLSETKVSKIAGRTSLVCLYGQSGSVQRYAPDNHVCKAVENGFKCKKLARISPVAKPLPIKPVVRPQTFSTGKIDVKQTYTVDLDRGHQGNGSHADLWLQAETQELLYLVPRNNARIAVGDRSNRGYSGCLNAAYSEQRVPLASVPVGSYVCIRTNEDRISQFRVNSIDTGVPLVLSLGYTTWK